MWLESEPGEVQIPAEKGTHRDIIPQMCHFEAKPSKFGHFWSILRPEYKGHIWHYAYKVTLWTYWLPITISNDKEAQVDVLFSW